MAQEIHFKIGHFRNFEGPVTLTLPSDDLESHIVAHILSTSTNITYWLVATLRTDGRLIVDGRMDGHVFTNSMSHLCSSPEMTNNSSKLQNLSNMANVRIKKDRHTAVRREWGRLLKAERDEKVEAQNAGHTIRFDCIVTT